MNDDTGAKDAKSRVLDARARRRMGRREKAKIEGEKEDGVAWGLLDEMRCGH